MQILGASVLFVPIVTVVALSMKTTMTSKRVAFGKVLTVIGGVVGYFWASHLLVDSCCGVVTYGNPVPNCGFLQGLAFRFQNFLSMGAAVLLAIPGILIWLTAEEGPSPPV